MKENLKIYRINYEDNWDENSLYICAHSEMYAKECCEEVGIKVVEINEVFIGDGYILD